MIKFFRKIRQKLLTENKFSKYLLYAIGEIVLVVIGILIALQINNWNENISNQLRFENILSELRDDLKTDIINSEKILNSNKKVDSLSRLILEQKISKDEYLEKGPGNLFWIGLQFSAFDYQKTAFKKFENFQGIIPEKYLSIVKNVNYYYNDLGQLHDDRYLNFRQQVKDRHDYLATKTNWYYLMKENKTTTEMIHFYINDPIYKNWISQHESDNTAGKYGTIKSMQSNGFGLLQTLTKLLGDSYMINNKNIIEKYGSPLNNINDFIGTYESMQTKNKRQYTQKNGYLYDDNFILKQIKKDTFIYVDYSSWEIVFTRDSNGMVNGIKQNHLKDSTKNQTAIKISSQ